MAKQHGNGSGKFDVGATDMGGWVRVLAGSTASAATNDLPFFLAHGLAQWLRQHPQLQLVSVVPITRNGETVELHAWYTQHLFPDASPAAKG